MPQPEAVKLSPVQLELGKKFREVMELQGTTDILLAFAAALDQYRCDYVLGPNSSIPVQNAIVALMMAVKS